MLEVSLTRIGRVVLPSRRLVPDARSIHYSVGPSERLVVRYAESLQGDLKLFGSIGVGAFDERLGSASEVIQR